MFGGVQIECLTMKETVMIKSKHSLNNSRTSKRKILFLLEAFDKGGIEKVTLDIVNHLDPNKYDITIQTFWYGGYCQSRVNSNIRVLPFFFRRYVRGIVRLIEILPPRLLHNLFIRGNYDVEIAASDGGAAKVVSGCTNQKTKKICWVHMDVVSRGSQLKEYQSKESAEKIYRKFDRIVCVSSACKEKFIEKFGEYRIDVAYNPLPTQEIISAAIEQCPTLNWSSTALHFVCIGRLVPQKGFDRLIDVCCRLKSLKYFGFSITILGEGPERNILERKIVENDLEDTIRLNGCTNNPYWFLKNASAFLLTSRDESFSLAVGESLIVGTPVIATDCCGVREWLGDNLYGLVVENSENGIFDGIKAVLDCPQILDNYKMRIPERTKELDFGATLDKFEKILW